MLSPLTRMRWRRRLRSLAALILLAAMAAAVWLAMPTPLSTVPLVHVIDGDSLTVRRDDAPVTLRLTGIDAVEYRQSCARRDGAAWACGRDARAALERLAGRGPLHCELGARDNYGRTLATCRTHPLPDGIELNAEMVRQGWAVATDDAYLPDEGEAESAGRGIWQGRFTRPADWRAAHQRPTP